MASLIFRKKNYFAENTRLTFLYDPALGPPRHIRKFSKQFYTIIALN